MGTPTANKNLIIPTLNGDFGTWGSEINGDISTLDLNLGGAQSVNIAGNTNVSASLAQSQYLFTLLTGALTGNVSYILPPVGGFYIIFNGTTGAARTVTIACAGGGTSTVIPQGTSMSLVCDGVNVISATTAYVQGGSTVTSSSLSTTGSATIGASLTVGSTLGVTGGTILNSTLSVAGATTVTGLLTSNGGFVSTGIDAAGNGGQFRATAGNYGAMLRNDGSNCYLLSTASGSPFGSFNAFRPYSWNLATGVVSIDQNGSGTVFGGGATVIGNFGCNSQITALGAVVGGTLISNGAAGIGTSLSIGTTLGVNGAATINGVTTVNNNLNISGSFLTTNGNITTSTGTVTAAQITSTGNINAANGVGCVFVNTGNCIGTVGTIGGVVFPGGGAENSVQVNTGTVNCSGNLVGSGLIVTNNASIGGLGITNNMTAGGNIFAGNGYYTHNGPAPAGNGPDVFNVWWDGAHIYIYIDATPFPIQTISDMRAKQDITPMQDGALGRINRLNPVSFRYRDHGVIKESEDVQEGLLAQEVRNIIPSAVHGDESNPDHILALMPNPLIATLIKAVQELSYKVDSQSHNMAKQSAAHEAAHTARMAQDEQAADHAAQLDALSARIAKLEAINARLASNFRVDL